jgi:hypothetical protein
MKQKRGQMKLSFGMIFSIILIVLFLAVAFFAISKFFDIQNSITIGKFADEFQNDIDKIWKSQQGSQPKEYSLPKGVISVCFVDYATQSKGERTHIYEGLRQAYFENENMIFYPVGSGQGLDAKEIKHINLEEITESENPFCIDNLNGKMNVILKKDFGETLVVITR